jgi:hypothetical protein
MCVDLIIKICLVITFIAVLLEECKLDIGGFRMEISIQGLVLVQFIQPQAMGCPQVPSLHTTHTMYFSMESVGIRGIGMGLPYTAMEQYCIQ